MNLSHPQQNDVDGEVDTGEENAILSDIEFSVAGIEGFNVPQVGKGKRWKCRAVGYLVALSAG